ncbi:translocation/assembly module TamB domain-containing protein [Lyngbya aestuarii]|uniref:translocation/assembly module TamB domain-containing protein n=1 Tax=Lyngbya aestuarii TaxID=118322 RepID=UPI00403DBC5F
MTNSPNSDQEPPSSSSNQANSGSPRGTHRRGLRRLWLFLGLFLLISLGGGLTWAWIFIHRMLAPRVEKSVENLLNRDVQLGEVESFSLNSLRFGNSTLPATPTDPDRVAIQALNVNYNPLKLIFNRTLELNITLVEPNIYIEQNEQGEWISTRLVPQPEGWLKIKLQTARVRGAEVVMVPRGTQGNLLKPVVFSLTSAKARFLNNNQLIQYNLLGQSATGGEFRLQGESQPATTETKLVVATSDLSAVEVKKIVPQLPIEPKAGLISGNLEIDIKPQEVLQLFGSLTLKDLTAQIAQLPQPLAKTNGQLRFQGTKVSLDNITSIFGQIPAQAKGVIDTQAGYNLLVQTKPIALKPVLQTFSIPELPVPASAEVQAVLKITGPPDNPLVVGKVTTTKPAQIDKVNLSKITGDFRLVATKLSLTINNLQAKPTVGGLVTGDGLVKLGENGTFVFDLQASEVPSEAIANTYNVDLPIPLGRVSAKTQIIGSLGNLQNLRATGQGNLKVADGSVTINNVEVAQGRWQGLVQAANIAVAKLSDNLPPQLQGRFDGTFNLSGSLDSFTPQTISGSGSGNMNIAGGLVSLTNIDLKNGSLSALVQADGVQLERLAEVPPQFSNPLSGQLQVAVNLDQLTTSGINGIGSASINLAGGKITANNIQLSEGLWQTNLQASSVQLGRLLPQLPEQLQAPLTGTFNLSGSLEQFALNTIKGSGSGSLNLAGGNLRTDIQLAAGRWLADVAAKGVQLGSLAPQLPPTLSGPLAGAFRLSGNLEQLSPTAINAAGSGRLQVAGGTVEVANLQLTNGNLQAVVTPNGIELGRFSQELAGSLGGRLNVSGNIANLTPMALAEALRAQGQLTFSEGISLIESPLTASVRWNGAGIEIQQATAQGISANGFIGVDIAALQNQGFPQAINNLNLDVTARDLNLQKLPIPLPDAAANLNIAGRGDFAGSISGTPTAPRIRGDLALRDFAIEELKFDPVMTGQVSALPGEGVSLQLTGNNDQIQLALDPNYQPTSFLVKQGEAIASGSRQGAVLVVQADNFPISTIKKFAPLPEAIASQPLAGDISGNLEVNLNTFGVTGDLAVANPIFGTIRGKQFSGSVQYTDGTVVLNNGELLIGDSRYLVTANLTPTAQGPEFQAKLEVPQGEIQDILTALQIFDLNDLTRGASLPDYQQAEDIAVAGVGLPGASLQRQLQRLSEIKALLEQQRQQRAAASPFPELSVLEGSLNGSLTLTSSPTSGISADFKFEGENWQWDDPYTVGADYVAQQVLIEGEFQDGVLTLLPLSFQTGDSIASFQGTIGGQEQTGRLALTKIPVNAIRQVVGQFVEVPPALGFGGLVNASATIAGSVDNPQARGDLSITDATLNQTPVQSVEGSFNYANARFDFSANSILTADAQPLNIEGSIPYQLPVATVEPESEELSLNIDVADQGLEIINVLSRGQVLWKDGTGRVNLDISGTIDRETNRPRQLVAEGIATVENATIEAPVLRGEPLTNVNGTAEFNFDRIEVANLQGDFSGGVVTAQGTIPIFQPAPQQNPLTVDIDKLALNLKGLYSGGVQGNVVITGTALAPAIGGQLKLFDGQVQLAGAGSGGEQAATTQTSNPTEFNDLELTLAEGVEIRQPPLLNFLADGSLTLNGPLDQISPQGEINLRRGRVNLFTTQFRLDRGYNNTARFLPGQGLDPALDVRLVASVTETERQPIPAEASAEISDLLPTGYGSVQTVRVQANVQGKASKLVESLVGKTSDNETLTLTSTPDRSDQEIIALLGGSFVDTLGRGDTTLGLANLAGSALLSNVGYAIGEALGLSEFRLYPTTIVDDDERASSLGVSAEAGVDIGRNLSVSVSKELTTDKPFEYNLRYRLREHLLLRGGTDFNGDGRVVVEYEKRF